MRVLERYPKRANETLQAWDAADDLILRQLTDRGPTPGEVVLIVNDNWGALSTALADRRPLTLSDSYLSHAAIRENLGRNQIDPGAVRLLTSFDPLPERIDLLLIKVPKNLALLEDELHRIAPHLHDKSTVLGGGMTKHIHMSTLDLFEKIVGRTRTSLAEKKARLIFSSLDPGLKRPPNPWPREHVHAGVFAGDHLDPGTRLLLDHIPESDRSLRIVDLGCGTGALGIQAAVKNPKAEIIFIDESYRAVASAEMAFRAKFGQARAAQFIVGNGLFDPADGVSRTTGVDLVLNNPPFHENHAVTDATAWQMFVESRDALRRGGQLWVVGNRHLGYPEKLKRLFGNGEVIASNARFVVLRSVRQ